MLDAKSARAQADENKIKVALANIEKNIKKAVAGGRDYIITLTAVSAQVEQELTDKGFKVEHQIGGTKISW
ncbi:MAG: hypothetical protein J6Q89_06440 [Clostridia bacterium]|jgi:hypothetical protein|nr:hypothetical protein [Clostridia bacterium]